MTASGAIVPGHTGFLTDDMVYAKLLAEARKEGAPFPRMELQRLLDRGRIRYAKDILERHSIPFANVLLADVEWRMGHCVAAMRRCREHSIAHPDDFESLDRLGRMSFSMSDMEGTCDAVSEAVDRGLYKRDYIVRSGVEAAWMIGRFDTCETLISALHNEGVRVAQAQGLVAAREAQAALDPAVLDPAFPDAVAMVLPLIREGKILQAVTIIRARILCGAPFGETMTLGRIAHDLGPPNWQFYFWASYRGALRYPGDPEAAFARASVIIKCGDVREGARLLARVAGIEGPRAPDVAALLAFCRAAGADVYESVLARAIEVAGLRDPDRVQIAAPWLEDAAPDPIIEGVEKVRDELDDVRIGLPAACNRKPRIAVCISGQLRSFRDTWAQTQRALEEWEPVYFLDTWDSVGAGIGAHATVDRILPPLIRDGLAQDLRNKEKFAAIFPTLYEAMIAFDRVDGDQLRNATGIEHVRVHSEQAFDAAYGHIDGIRYKGALNQAKMFAMMSNAFEQKNAFERQTGIVFDAVLRLRPDRAMRAVSPDDVEAVSGNRLLLTDNYLPTGVGDQVFLSSSLVANIVCGLWPNMLAHQTPKFFAGSSGRFNEFLLADFLLANRVGLGRMIGTGAEPLSSPMLSVDQLWNKAADDFLGANSANPETLRGFSVIHEICRRDAGFAPSPEKLEAVSSRLGAG